jgi:hypothetical protein
VESNLSGSHGLVIKNIGLNVYGGPAYELSDMHEYVVYQGFTLAHDLCEHRAPEDIGTLADEFLAFGASTFVRDPDYYYNNKSPCFDIWDAMVNDFTDNNNFMAYNPKKFAHLHSARFKDNGIDTTVDLLIDKVKTFFTRERIIGMVVDTLPHDVDEEKVDKKVRDKMEVLNSYIDDVERCMYLGHHLATKRYKHDHMAACKTFQAIETTVDSFFEGEAKYLPEDSNLRLNYDRNKAFMRYEIN